MIWLAFLVLAVIVATPLIREWLRQPVTARRAGADGQFAPLSEGVTHYRWHGPETGPVLVCVHGLTTPMIAYDAIADGLAARGFRVLTYDLYGRGLSDRPDAHHSRGLFVTQLSQLLRDQQVTGPVTLIGYSMGGSIVTAFAAEMPDEVRRLVLLAPAGIQHRPSRMARLATMLPGLGDWLMLAVGARIFRRAAQRQRRLAPKVTDAIEVELNTRGYLPAILSSQRGMLSETLEDEHRALAKAGLPITAIWGQADDVIPLAARDRLSALNHAVQQHVVPGAGHGLPFTHAFAVLDALGGDIAAA